MNRVSLVPHKGPWHFCGRKGNGAVTLPADTTRLMLAARAPPGPLLTVFTGLKGIKELRKAGSKTVNGAEIVTNTKRAENTITRPWVV